MATTLNPVNPVDPVFHQAVVVRDPNPRDLLAALKEQVALLVKAARDPRDQALMEGLREPMALFQERDPARDPLAARDPARDPLALVMGLKEVPLAARELLARELLARELLARELPARELPTLTTVLMEVLPQERETQQEERATMVVRLEPQTMVALRYVRYNRSLLWF